MSESPIHQATPTSSLPTPLQTTLDIILLSVLIIIAYSLKSYISVKVSSSQSSSNSRTYTTCLRNAIVRVLGWEVYIAVTPIAVVYGAFKFGVSLVCGGTRRLFRGPRPAPEHVAAEGADGAENDNKMELDDGGIDTIEPTPPAQTLQMDYSGLDTDMDMGMDMDMDRDTNMDLDMNMDLDAEIAAMHGWSGEGFFEDYIETGRE